MRFLWFISKPTAKCKLCRKCSLKSEMFSDGYSYFCDEEESENYRQVAAW